MNRSLRILALLAALAGCSQPREPVPITPPVDTQRRRGRTPPVARVRAGDTSGRRRGARARAGRGRPTWRDLRLRVGGRRRAHADRDRVRAEGRRDVREAPRDGTVPIRARHLPAQRRPRLRVRRRRDHRANRSRIRQEGDARSLQGELRGGEALSFMAAAGDRLRGRVPRVESACATECARTRLFDSASWEASPRRASSRRRDRLGSQEVTDVGCLCSSRSASASILTDAGRAFMRAATICCACSATSNKLAICARVRSRAPRSVLLARYSCRDCEASAAIFIEPRCDRASREASSAGFDVPAALHVAAAPAG